MTDRLPSSRRNFRRGNKREPQNRRVIALDHLEEMDAEALDLIASDAREQRFAALYRIGLYKGAGKPAARESGDRNRFEQNGVRARDATSRMKFMVPPGQSLQRGHKSRPVCGLGQKPVFNAEGLVRADDKPFRHLGTDGQGFGARKMKRDLSGRGARFKERRFDATFIDFRFENFERDTARSQKAPARRAFRGENDGKWATPQLGHDVAMNFN